MSINLKGTPFLIGRPMPQARGLASLITACDGVAIVQPAIEIIAAPDDEPTLTNLDRLDQYDAAIFTSASGVGPVLKRTPRREWPKSIKIYTVGQATRKHLLQAGFPQVTAPPPERSGIDGLNEILGDTRGQRILMVAPPDGRKSLAESLDQAGATVDWLHSYRRRPATLTPANERLVKGHWGRLIVIGTSAAVLRSQVRMFERITGRPLVVPSKRLRDIARELGFGYVAVSQRPDDESMLTIAQRFIES